MAFGADEHGTMADSRCTERCLIQFVGGQNLKLGRSLYDGAVALAAQEVNLAITCHRRDFDIRAEESLLPMRLTSFEVHAGRIAVITNHEQVSAVNDRRG